MGMRLIDITRPLDPEDINKLPPERRDPLDTVVELQMEGSGGR